MDEEFLQKLKKFSVKDVLEDQRPVTGKARISTAKSRSQSQQQPKVIIEDGSGNVVEEVSNETGSSLFSVRRDKPVLSDLWKHEGKPSKGGVSEFLNPMETSNGIEFIRSASASSTQSSKSSGGNREETIDYIPDLDDVQEEDLASTVAAAPMVEAERITSLRELDADLSNLKTFSVVRGVDLRRLARFVIPQKNLMDFKERPKKLVNYQIIKAELAPYFNKRNKLDFPRNPDGSLLLSDKIKKNQLKAKEMADGGDPTFPIDRQKFPKSQLNRRIPNPSMSNNAKSVSKSVGNQSVHQLLKNTEELRKKATRAEEASRKNVPAHVAKGSKPSARFKANRSSVK